MNAVFPLELRWSDAWILLGYITVLATLAGFASRFWWVLELASHFRLQYLIILTGLTVAFAVTGHHKSSLIFLLGSALNLAVIFPSYVGGSNASAADLPLRVMALNVQRSNQNYAQVKRIIAQHSPDLIVLQEVDAAWLHELSVLNKQYPYTINEARNTNFGIALFSKFALQKADVVYLSDVRFPSLLAEVAIGERRITILGTHPPPPKGAFYAQLRNNQLAAIVRARQRANGPFLLLGDLNTSPWSYHFISLLEEAGLYSAARGYGVLPTWPAQLFPIGIPIDHCLHSEEIKVVDFRLGEQVGSDHLPIVVDLMV